MHSVEQSNGGPEVLPQISEQERAVRIVMEAFGLNLSDVVVTGEGNEVSRDVSIAPASEES